MRSPTLLACLFLAVASAGADDLAVLKDGSPRSMLSDFLKAEAGKAFDARRATIAAIKTPEAFAARQKSLRARFVEALGDLPEKTPLKARVVGTEARDGYRLEKVVYESRPDHHVTGLFYLPEGTPPFPAVLLPCGHDPTGKAAEAYQRACILLARNGIAVLCYDPIGQGERRQVLTPDGKPDGAGNTTEHTQAHVGAVLVGRSAAGYHLWDAIRGLDYLTGRPEVDARRLGCTGCSGGGTLTSYLMALDDRVAAAAPSCYITSLERLFATIGPQDAEQNIPGQVALGLEHADYLGLRAPRPTLVLSSSRDFFDQQGTWTTFREAKRAYTLLGHPERVEIVEADEPHGYCKAHRLAMTGWMRRWLLGKDDVPVEADTSVSSDAALLCTRTGQVLSEFHGKSVFDLNAEAEGELARRRSELSNTRDRDAMLADVRRLIALPSPIKPAGREDRGEVRSGTGTIRKLVFATEPGIQVPGRLYTPGTVERDTPMVVMIGFGASDAASMAMPVEGLTPKGWRVLSIDLRGMGETAPLPARQWPIGDDWQESFLSFHLGRPLLGQRVGDLLSVLAALAEESPGGFHLVARGTAGPIALHAAALEPKILSLTIDGSITSWAEVVRTPLSKDQLANVVPGALKSYDLPDLAALLAPRPLNIRKAVDPKGQPVASRKP